MRRGQVQASCILSLCFFGGSTFKIICTLTDPLGGLILLLLCNVLFASSTLLALKSTLLDINIATPAS